VLDVGEKQRKKLRLLNPKTWIRRASRGGGNRVYVNLASESTTKNGHSRKKERRLV